MYKLRVEFIKSLGFMFAVGDEYEYSTGYYNSTQKLRNIIEVDCAHKSTSTKTILSFADRINTDNTGYTGLDKSFPVVWTYRHGVEYKTQVDDGLIWNSNIVSWRPNYDELLKMQKEYDDNTNNGLDRNGKVKYMPEEEALDLLHDCIEITLQVGEDPVLSEPEQPTQESINWTDESQYALVGKGGDVVLLETLPTTSSAMGMVFYLYKNVPYRMKNYTLIKKEKKQMKLTSKDIDWEEGMKYAVVNTLKSTVEFHVDEVTINPYWEGSLYLVKREEQSDNLIYTKEMYNKGELPTVGMKCIIDYKVGNTFTDTTINYISDTGFTHTDNTTGIELFVGTLSDKVIEFLPIETEQDKKDKLEQELLIKVAKVLCKVNDGLTHHEFFADAEALLRDGLLAPVGDSNES